jgi:hypothetical protein
VLRSRRTSGTGLGRKRARTSTIRWPATACIGGPACEDRAIRLSRNRSKSAVGSIRYKRRSYGICGRKPSPRHGRSPTNDRRHGNPQIPRLCGRADRARRRKERCSMNKQGAASMNDKLNELNRLQSEISEVGKRMKASQRTTFRQVGACLQTERGRNARPARQTQYITPRAVSTPVLNNRRKEPAFFPARGRFLRGRPWDRSGRARAGRRRATARFKADHRQPTCRRALVQRYACAR